MKQNRGLKKSIRGCIQPELCGACARFASEPELPAACWILERPQLLTDMVVEPRTLARV